MYKACLDYFHQPTPFPLQTKPHLNNFHMSLSFDVHLSSCFQPSLHIKHQRINFFNNLSLFFNDVIIIYLCINDSMMIQLQVDTEALCSVDSFVYPPQSRI